MRKKVIDFRPLREAGKKKKREVKKMNNTECSVVCVDSWCSSTVEERLDSIRRNAKQRTGRSLQAKAVPIREAFIDLPSPKDIRVFHRLREELYKNFLVDIFYIDIFSNQTAHVIADWTDHQTGLTLKLSRLDLSQLQDVTADILGIDRGFSIADLNKKEKNLRREIAALELVKAGTQNLLGRLGMSQKDKVITLLKEKIQQLESQLAEKDEELSNEKRKILQLEEYRKNIQSFIRSKDLEIRDLEKWKKNSLETIVQYEKILKRHGLLK